MVKSKELTMDERQAAADRLDRLDNDKKARVDRNARATEQAKAKQEAEKAGLPAPPTPDLDEVTVDYANRQGRPRSAKAARTPDEVAEARSAAANKAWATRRANGWKPPTSTPTKAPAKTTAKTRKAPAKTTAKKAPARKAPAKTTAKKTGATKAA